MKIKIILASIILLALVSPVFSSPQQRSSQPEVGFETVFGRVGTQPQIGNVPTQPNNPLPTPDQLYYPLTIYFDDYFDSLYDFMDANVPSQQLEPHWIINLNTQSWEAFYFPSNEQDWDNLENKWLIIECWWGKYDHFPSFVQIYPPVPPQPGGFYFNELFSGLGRVVEIGVAVGESYILNEEQFNQFLLQGYTTVLIEQGPEQNME